MVRIGGLHPLRQLARSAFGVGAEPATPALIVVPGRAVVDTGAPAGKKLALC